jgi:hypothetical protein
MSPFHNGRHISYPIYPIGLQTLLNRPNKLGAFYGYEKNFVLENVMADESLIISEQDGSLQIIAGDTEKYDASYWVSDVVKITVS